MSSIQHLAVFPKLPTILADQAHLDLPGYDIFFNHVNSLHVAPIKLDVPRFQEALARVLQLYPHAAGKLRYVDSRWVIELTNTAIPLNIEFKADSSSDSFLKGDMVVQDDLSPFIDTPLPGANFSDESTPLLCVKLTLFHDETCIGVAWQHLLGDATTQFRFLHTLSQFYQDLSSEFRNAKLEEGSLSCTIGLCPIAGSIPSIEPVNWRIDDRDIEEHLQSALSSKKQSGPSLSKQDCITAYFVAVLNVTRSDPVRSIRNITSYRHIKAPFITENAAGNVFMDVFVNVPADMAGIATAVRSSFIRCQDPDYIYRWVTVTNHIKSEAYNTWKAPALIMADDKFGVNSVTGIDWCSTHLGCPDGTQFYTNGLFRNSLRVSRSNPVKGVDGVWQARRSVDITMGVAPEVKPKVLEIFARGVRYMLQDQLEL